ACLPWIGFRPGLRRIDLEGKSERAAIAMPQAIAAVKQNTEWRRLEVFGPHRPLLERLIGRVGRKIGRRPQGLRQWQDQRFRPGIERVRPAITLPPARKMRPDRTTDIAEEDDRAGGSAVIERRPLACIEARHPAQHYAMRIKRRRNLRQWERAAHRGYSGL